jgi:hypothetical protein
MDDPYMLLEPGYYINGLENEIVRNDRGFCIHGEPERDALRSSAHCNEI